MPKYSSKNAIPNTLPVGSKAPMQKVLLEDKSSIASQNYDYEFRLYNLNDPSLEQLINSSDTGLRSNHRILSNI